MTMAGDLRVLIVDDEPLARRRLKRLLEAEDGVECVGECATGEEAVAWLRSRTTDVALLDVQMPGLSGFDVVEAVGPRRMPPVVFVTAHDQYAIRAFGVHAVDYLLKPFDSTRLRQALERTRARMAGESRGALARRLERLLRAVADRPERPSRVVVKRTGALSLVNLADVDWIEAQGNYVALHVGPQAHLMRDTLSRVESRLDADRFVRVRRTAIVNVDRISRLDPWEKDEHVVVMASGARIVVSRGFAHRLERVLATWKI